MARQLLIGVILVLPIVCPTMLLGQQEKADAKAENFVMQASASGLAEVAMAKLAQTQSADAAVKKFANQMVEDHTSANRELESLAKKYLLKIAKEADKERQQTIERLSKLKGGDFDRLYVNTMVKSHTASKELFQAQSLRGQNPDLKEFATRTLPVIEHHLKMVGDLASRIPE
jgi:putative membrane protein